MMQRRAFLRTLLGVAPVVFCPQVGGWFRRGFGLWQREPVIIEFSKLMGEVHITDEAARHLQEFAELHLPRRIIPGWPVPALETVPVRRGRTFPGWKAIITEDLTPMPGSFGQA